VVDRRRVLAGGRVHDEGEDTDRGQGAAEHDRDVDLRVVGAGGCDLAEPDEALRVEWFPTFDRAQCRGEHERDDLLVPTPEPVVPVGSDAVQRWREQQLRELRAPLVERQPQPLPGEQHGRPSCVVALGRHRASNVSGQQVSCPLRSRGVRSYPGHSALPRPP
jgi:hypothetical protein